MNEIKQYYTWEQFDRDVQKIAYWVRQQSFDLKNIYGVPRGGLVLAVKLSHALGLPLILSHKDIDKHTLVVDDIIDTGGTLDNLFKKKKRSYPVVSIHVGGDPLVQPDFYLHQKEQWIVYPWETDESSAYDGTLEEHFMSNH